MYNRIVVSILLCAFVVGAQTINLQGIVSNNTGKAVANATVTLVRQGMNATTGSDGKYSFIKTHVAGAARVAPDRENVSLQNGVLQFSLSGSSPVRFEFFDINGKLLKKEILNISGAGLYQYNVEKQINASNLMIIKAVIGNRELSIPYMTFKNGRYLKNSSSVQSGSIGSLAYTAAVTVDTIKVTAAGYQTKSVAITSYENQQQNITLDPVSNGKNPPVPSAGCGKPLSALKTGTYKITSSGSQREYTVNIPSNYDPNKPYWLIYCSHWIYSSDDDVSTGRTVKSTPAGIWAYYGLKHIADSVGEPCIFIAPQSSNGMWGQNDHVLLDDILKFVKGELCVDTTRVFATGFSFGAMITYSFSLNHQGTLRAVCCLAAANYNIYLPTNTHRKIAYMGIVGMSDGTCPPSAGRACRDTHVADNGCTKPNSVPETNAGSKTHVVYDYQGCAEGYPVKWCTFDGGHMAAPYDGGGGDDGNKTWIPKETWKFFSQF